ncbi:hypothetical protein B9Z55_021093 [Caenorhabditis nigoni]|uniref:Uncharacterized protein n=1 Tax=Caenorhabditis nigoni TaxID=1611254 RepID=A0A2G5TQM1_9PELO|nr:hypothetical protein B9Z55_021093 [Caenorhabditis nigoni]
MNEAIVKEEVIEEPYNFTFKNGEYIEVKQEEVEQKPEHLLGQKIKIEPIDFFENDNSDGFSEDVQLEPKECGSEIANVSTEFGGQKCKICQKKMARNLLKLITSEEDRTVLSQIFKDDCFKEMNTIYVCYSHIQTIIDDNDGKVKFASTPSEKRLLSFIRKNKKLMQVNEKSINLIFRIFQDQDITKTLLPCL